MGDLLSKDVSECEPGECAEKAPAVTETAAEPLPAVQLKYSSDADDECTSLSPPPSPKRAPRRARRSGHARVAQTPPPAEPVALDTGWGFCTVVVPALMTECLQDPGMACTIGALVLFCVFFLGFTLGRFT
jgi:hypothetical protein